MVSIKEASRVTETFRPMSGEGIKEIKAPIFEDSEIQRAETIVSALNGLTIESAQQLLEQVKLYLLQKVID